MAFAFDKAVMCIPEFDGSHEQLQNFINVVDIFVPSIQDEVGLDANGNLTAVGEAYLKAEKQLLVAVRMKLKGKALEQAPDLMQKTWLKTKNKIVEAFQVSNSMESISRMITTLRQAPDESFTNYKARADTINVYVRQLKNDYADRQLRIFFIAGLLDEDLVDLAKTQKVDNYLELAKLLEDAANYHDEVNYIRNSMQGNINYPCLNNNDIVNNNNVHGSPNVSNYCNQNATNMGYTLAGNSFYPNVSNNYGNSYPIPGNNNFQNVANCNTNGIPMVGYNAMPNLSYGINNGFQQLGNIRNGINNAGYGFNNVQPISSNVLTNTSLNNQSNIGFNRSLDNYQNVDNIPYYSNETYSSINNLNNNSCYNNIQNENNNCQNTDNFHLNNMIMPNSVLSNNNEIARNANENLRQRYDQQNRSMNIQPIMNNNQSYEQGMNFQGNSTAFFTTNPVNESQKKGYQQSHVKTENNISFNDSSDVINSYNQTSADNESVSNELNNVINTYVSPTQKHDVIQSEVSLNHQIIPYMLTSSSKTNQKVSSTHLFCTTGKIINNLPKQMECSKKRSSKSKYKEEKLLQEKMSSENERDKYLSRLKNVNCLNIRNRNHEVAFQHEIRKPQKNSVTLPSQDLNPTTNGKNNLNFINNINPVKTEFIKTGLKPLDSVQALSEKIKLNEGVEHSYKDRWKIPNKALCAASA